MKNFRILWLNEMNSKILLISIVGLPIVLCRYYIVKFHLSKEVLILRALVELILLPLYLYIATQILARSIIKDLDERDKHVIFLLFMFSMIGHGAHFSADLLDIVQTKLNPYNVDTGDPYQRIQVYAYFLDEIISHKIMFYPIFALLFYFMVREAKNKVDV